MYILERIAFILDGALPIMFLVSGIGILISSVSLYEDNSYENFRTLFFISIILLMVRIIIPYEINCLWVR